jgi:hypothetical protein
VVDAGDPGEREASSGVPEPGHRQAALVDEFRFSGQLDDHGVEDVPDVPVDVVAERAQVDADLGGSHPGTARQLDAVDKVVDEAAYSRVDGADRLGAGFQDGIAQQADLAFGHGERTFFGRRGVLRWRVG